MSDDGDQMSTGDEHTTVSRGEQGQPTPPAANQKAAEPVPSAPEESPQASGGSAAPSHTAGDQAAGSGTRPGVDGSGVPAPGAAPGEAAGVPVPSVHAAAGTSEENEAVKGVRTTAVTAPGKPDGEVDTRA